MLKDKIKASLIHLLLSAVLISATLGIIIYFWYPTEYIGITRFQEIGAILIAVDLVMGPALTFIIFNRHKKSLPFDLAVIALLQVAALGYGGYTLFQAHPLYITFTVDRYTMVSAQDASPNTAQYEEYKVSKLSSGNLAFAALPDSLEERNKLMLGVAAGAPDLDQRIDLYKPYQNNIQHILEKSLDTDKLMEDQVASHKLKQFLQSSGGTLEQYALLPLNGPKKHVILVIDKKSALPISIIDAEPWQYIKRAI